MGLFFFRYNRDSFYPISIIVQYKKIIDNNSSIERLKSTLYNHIIEMFNGVIDESFIKQRYIIAYVHVKMAIST
ncbi:protoglobin domain-containing protein [Litchfieldia alkalitelluris]|uniref:protoglobin domain-containing protein n=1 Tax=Litchfieldia alkalitelluris TaxID=304268 RepID=UPI001473095E